MTITADVGNSSRHRTPVVVVVVHRAMRELIVELLNRDNGSWAVSVLDSVSELDQTASLRPDLVIVDTADFTAVRHQLPAHFPVTRLVVIGPEPDPAYRRAALDGGAGGWLSRECVAEELCNALRSALARARLTHTALVELHRPPPCSKRPH